MRTAHDFSQMIIRLARKKVLFSREGFLTRNDFQVKLLGQCLDYTIHTNLTRGMQRVDTVPILHSQLPYQEAFCKAKMGHFNKGFS